MTQGMSQFRVGDRVLMQSGEVGSVTKVLLREGMEDVVFVRYANGQLVWPFKTSEIEVLDDSIL